MSVLQQLLAGGAPGLRGYNAEEERTRAANAQQVQQAGQLQAILGQAAAQQKARHAAQLESQFRAEIGQATTPEAQLAVAMKYGGPDAVAKTAAGHMDRQASIQAANTNKEAARDQRIWEVQEGQKSREREIAQKAAEGRISAEQANAQLIEGRRQNAMLMAALRPAPQEREAPPPIVQRKEDGSVSLYDRSGNLIKDLGKVGTPSAQFQKVEQQKKQQTMDLNRAIVELDRATKDGGLIDQSTGSGAGALVDMGAAFIGKSTPGAVAVGEMKPIYDLILKMVPRFEGPQSDKDTKTYEDASGQLANPAVPNETKKAAGKEILRLMKDRRAQFVSKDMISEGGAGAPTAPKFLGFEQ